MKMTTFFNGLLIFVLLIGIITGISNSFTSYYDVEDNYYQEINEKNGTITYHFNIISNDINSSVSSITQGIASISKPTNPLDILGGLASLGIGILKGIWSILVIPAKILDILIVFYSFPQAIINFITASFLVTFAFIIVRTYIKEEI
jgi:hypothetical protein